jgi:peptide-methionine (S)-S-oxide reductase
MRLPTLIPTFSGARYLVVALALVSAVLAVGARVQAASGTTELPPPMVDARPNESRELQTAVFAGGCFWGVQAVFQHVKGVRSAVSGYAGGAADDAKYEIVSSGATGHAESVQVVFDPTQVSYGQLLTVFFSVAHDPTQLNRQGPDRGTQYRSAIFTTSADQKRIAESYIAQLDAARVFDSSIVTRVAPLNAFYPAEAYHQDYATLHPYNAYIVFNDAPKLVDLRQRFPDLYVAKPVLVASS